MDCNNYYNYSVCTYSSWQMPTIIMWPFKNNMCSWNYKVTRDLRQLWQRQQKQHKKQLVLWPKQQLHTWIMLFSTFLWRLLHDYDVEPLQCDIKWRTWTHDNKFSFLYFNMDKALKISTPGNVAYIWQIERFQRDPIKFEQTQIQCFSDLFTAVIVVVA